jgi:hypothetical protein
VSSFPLSAVSDSNLPPKRPIQQRLEQMLRLALRLALLGAQPLESLDDVGELLLEGELWKLWTTKAFYCSTAHSIASTAA